MKLNGNNSKLQFLSYKFQDIALYKYYFMLYYSLIDFCKNHTFSKESALFFRKTERNTKK